MISICRAKETTCPIVHLIIAKVTAGRGPSPPVESDAEAAALKVQILSWFDVDIENK
jgi:hypothetical protein